VLIRRGLTRIDHHGVKLFHHGFHRQWWNECGRCSTSTNLLRADSSFCSCPCRRSAATFHAPVAHDDDAIVGQHNREMLRWRCIAVVLATMRLRISCTSMWGVSGFGSSARDYGYG
jgi:hypothetical protein